MLDAWRVPVVRIRDAEGTKDQYNEPIPGEPVSVDLPPALFGPSGTDLASGAGVAATVTEPAVYWPGEWPDVQTGDRLIVDGYEWRVDGIPAKWPLGLAVALTGTHSTRSTP
ncbi:hypothetical protein [Pseudoclavibacter terrae]|uniref:Head-to-tail stopper n=1 Tax=Pseudoclavibacter terrae TaxID=1530195 RepID=A0A7J5B6V5_9MICO|nr:hypothetical protein [Pseudoclavibacter terrae]KAB1639864.1 hypothetical protein F8O03_06025 [Pseudoclavibacter terrae]